MLADLTVEERKAFLYRYRDVPSIARVDPNSIHEPPFPEGKMSALLKSANDKTTARLIEKIANDEPTIFG